ncbi:MAG TPA: DNA polymerase I, partial [Clostridiales bacterium]|nr:DNA polymerase I [Clostridiales bacterium]
MNKKEKLVLIDGNSLINRAFYALPLLKNSSGEYSNAVYGFCNILLKLIETEQPKYMAVAFDMGHPTFRHQMFENYKAGRKKMPDELAMQLPILKKVLSAMNITFIEQKGIEADDLIGTLSKKFDIQTIIVSGDRDLFQLVDETTSVWFTKKGISEAIVVTPKNIKEVYGVNANQVVDLKSLMGDSSDNIKGVAGIGEKGAKNLIDAYGSVENLYAHIDEITGATKQKLLDGKEDCQLSKQLATIKTDVELSYTLEDLTYDFPFNKDVYNIFNHYEFWSILKRTELFNSEEVKIQQKVVNKKEITNLKELDELVKNLLTTNEISLHILDGEIHIANSKFEENIVKIDESNGKFTSTQILEKFKEILENNNIKKILLNAKETMHYLKNFNIEINTIGFDCNLALYLLSGSQKTSYDAKMFAEKYGYNEDCIAVSLFATKTELINELKKESMLSLYNDIELPLVSVLFNMEQSGFKVDTDELLKLSEKYSAELNDLTQKIYLDAGEEFNIKSPKQLSVILFDKLKLQLPKRMKMSTGVEVLERIISQHPIIEKILRFRKIEKLQSTYIEPFLGLAEKDTNLIHTIFNQTLTSTGRLSSSEPNLQNIPVRDDEGKLLRKIFISRFENGKIITSDYSQIELRLVAHFSQDSKLLDAYKNNVDIHTQTASDIFEVPINFVNDKMRRDAKAVNFGIIYGISDFGLAQNIGVSRQEAKAFIDKYFETYVGVKSFMKTSVEKAKELGYVTTLFGRKRNIEELKSDNYMTRMFGERAAMNMPLQGTASDIIKIAMVEVYNEFKKQKLNSKLILQIHD